MAMPRKLKDLNLFTNGDDWKGEIATVTPPKLQRNMVEYRGGGMQGPIEIDMGLQKLEMSFVVAGFAAEHFKNWGTHIADTDTLRFRGSYESDETGEVRAVEITCRGRYSNIDMGDAKLGEDTQHTITASLNYYRLVDNGKELIEVDIINNICKVDGVDRLAERRRALGMA
ncbi:hypothetical protein R84981_001133 [Carnimonas sp. R-84981]|uniref:phage major tail tube protein n=1 Tax=Carnimonas bestiolae TaxID=3402172 RepID=UPI003EDBF13A